MNPLTELINHIRELPNVISAECETGSHHLNNLAAKEFASHHVFLMAWAEGLSKLADAVEEPTIKEWDGWMWRAAIEIAAVVQNDGVQQMCYQNPDCPKPWDCFIAEVIQKHAPANCRITTTVVPYDAVKERAEIVQLNSRALAERDETIALLSQQLADKKEIIRRLTI